jgi:hypothetical protein
LATAAVGLALLAQIDATSSIWDVAWRLGVTGIGQGLFQSPNTRAVMDSAPAAEQGEASGLLATARVSGQALSVSIAGAVFSSLGGAAAGRTLIADRADATLVGISELGLRATFVHALQSALLLCAAFAAAGALIALARGRERSVGNVTQDRSPVAAKTP